jgi:hypothetical protein
VALLLAKLGNKTGFTTTGWRVCGGALSAFAKTPADFLFKNPKKVKKTL